MMTLPVVPDTGDERPEANLDPGVAHELQRLRTSREARRLLAAELRAQVDPPEIVTLAELLTRPQAPVEHRIEGLQPRDSRVMLVAARKSGKTTLVGNLTRALVDGRKFLGCLDVMPMTGRVAILDFELSPQMAVRWLADQEIQNTDRVVLISMRGHAGAFDIRDEAVRKEWASRLRDADVEYLILDCLTPVMDALGIDKNNAMGTFLTPFDALITEAGISDALVVHHSGWGQERGRGDSTVEGWPDAIWRLTRADESDTAPRFLSAFGRDVDFPETALHFEPSTRRLTLGEGSRRDAAAVNALAAVVEVLKASGEPMSTRAIEMALADTEHPRNAIRNALQTAKDTSRLTSQPGPRNATLWQFASSPQFAASSPARSSEFASAPIERRTELTQFDGAVRGERTDMEVRL